jgi:hypothetical protein
MKIYNMFLVRYFLLIVSVIMYNVTFAQTLNNESWMWYNDSEVAIVEITIDPADLAWVYDQNNWQSDSLHLCSVHFKNAVMDETIDSVGFRLRGNTSRDSQKKSFKLSFNTFIPGRQIHDIEKLNLNGEHNDPSIVRSKLCWDLFQEIGLTASRAAHAAVYINGDYFGLYISVEHIDDEFVDNHFADPSGNLWKCLYPADLTWRGENAEDYYPFVDDVRPYELKTNEDDYDFEPLAHLIKIITQTRDAYFEDSLETILHVPEFLKYLAVDVMTGSWDDYWALMNNYYLYYEPVKDIFHWIPYDYDNTFSVDWKGIDWATADPYEWPRYVEGERPLADRIMQNTRYRNLYTHFLKFYSEEVFYLPVWENRLDSLKEMITPWAELDYFRTLDYNFTMDDFNNSYTDGVYSNQHVKRGLKNYVGTRTSYLRSQLSYVSSGPIVYEIDYFPKHPSPDDSVYVTAAAFSPDGLKSVDLQVLYGDNKNIENVPMKYTPVYGTKHVEDIDRWTGTFAPITDRGFAKFVLFATDKNNRSQIYPRTEVIVVETSVSETGGLFINEFLARNSTVNMDNNGDYEDWLEIYNPNDSAVNLAGMYLSDDPDNLTRWQFPSEDSEIGPKGFLLVWCDDNADPTELHTNFKLDGDGEFIALTASDGITVIDSLSFGDQGENISFGRNPDGSSVWTSMNPTPGSTNNTTGIRDTKYPKEFNLSVYPNPFNPETEIKYGIPEGGYVNLSIFNTLGQKVITLINSRQAAGTYKIRWDGKNTMKSQVGAGLYFCRFQVGKKEIVRRLVLLK